MVGDAVQWSERFEPRSLRMHGFDHGAAVPGENGFRVVRAVDPDHEEHVTVLERDVCPVTLALQQPAALIESNVAADNRTGYGSDHA